MLTVKWIAENGSEMIYEARGEVSFTPGHARDVQSTLGPNKAVVSFESPDGVHTSVDIGEVFVMNAKGSTVARYTLSSVDFPHGFIHRAA